MDLKKLAEPFPAEDIEWRVQSSGTSNGVPWARVLAYVTARAIMGRLDEVVGPENWKPRYTYEGGGVMCYLSIRVSRENGDMPYWVEKGDGAEQTDIEKFKGGISSALKRAASVWGIGRYLYKLETGFAECDKNTKRFPNYGKTKEGTQFSWTPPDLPEWALPSAPKAKKKTKKAEKEELDAKRAERLKAHPDVTLATGEQLKAIGILRRELEIPEEEYRAKLIAKWGVASASDLTEAQAVELLKMLKARQKAANDDDARVVFSNGRIEELQKSAVGFCTTVERMGDTYADKTPIDYKKEGLVVDSLEELVQVIASMTEEKELEGVITRLDALVQTMSF